MTSSRAQSTSGTAASVVALAVLAAGVLALGLAGCGDYSNEDLEYMNAVPASHDLDANLPARPLSVPATDEAELAVTTHNVTKTFNAMIDGALGLIDTIRSYPPTSRGSQSRTWGPVPTDNQPGWDWRLTVTRQDAVTFSYALEFHNQTGAADLWLPFMSGQFQAATGARRGVGELQVVTSALRAAGFVFDGDGKLDTLDVHYATLDYPFTVDMTLTTFPNAPDLMVMNSVDYHYAVAASGQGAMSFTLTGDIIKTTAAIEVVAVTSRWLPEGTGRADLVVQQGDGAGLHQTECWDDLFRPIFNDKPWSQAEDVGQISACPAIPTL